MVGNCGLWHSVSWHFPPGKSSYPAFNVSNQNNKNYRLTESNLAIASGDKQIAVRTLGHTSGSAEAEDKVMSCSWLPQRMWVTAKQGMFSLHSSRGGEGVQRVLLGSSGGFLFVL